MEMTMRKRRTFALALAAIFAFGGIAETTPQASAAERPTAASIDKVRADAMARLAEGDVQNVDRRGRGRGRGWEGGMNYGRGYGRGGRGYGRGNYGRNRGYYGRGYGRRGYYDRGYRRHRGRNIALGVGAAALAIGAIAAANQNNGSRGDNWCARRYRTYDYRSGTYIAAGGVRRSCP
jgi:hypothetical protein